MEKEVVLVQWFTDVGQIRPRQELRKFDSREARLVRHGRTIRRNQTAQCPDDC
jgi:hypothetical protein